MYQPSSKTLDRYADILINFALWGGKGVKAGETVLLSVPESAKPMLKPLMKTVLAAQAHFIIDYHPEDVSAFFYEHANEKQLTYSPKKYLLQKIETCDHIVSIISTDNKFELKQTDPAKIMLRNKSLKYYLDARRSKENKGKLSWTLGLYGTEAMAEEAGMSLQSYWRQIIRACYLDQENPIAQWQKVFRQIESIKNKLNKLDIDIVHIKGKDADLKIKVGEKRQWLGGGGRNIPSFEIFVSPDWRNTQGWIRFNQPLYRYGNLITGIELKFDKGKVVTSKAKTNYKLLMEMLKVPNADKIGEFSLTDGRFSKITRFMAETLYDENAGGKYGNTHIALGMAYQESYAGSIVNLTPEQAKKLGFNDSAIHTDIVSTTNRKVTAHLNNGQSKVIYQDGRFCI